jgi:hypothetical protein
MMFRFLLDAAAAVVVIGITVIVLCIMAVGAAVGAVRRGLHRLRGFGVDQRRPLSSRCGRRLLDLRAMADPDPTVRRITALRSRLADEMDATDRMLSETGDGRVFTADARALLNELRESAESIDVDLRAVAAYRDPTLQQNALALLTEQAEHLIAVSYGARQTVLETSVHDRWGQIARMTAEVDQQAAAFARYRNDDGSELDLDIR